MLLQLAVYDIIISKIVQLFIFKSAFNQKNHSIHLKYSLPKCILDNIFKKVDNISIGFRV